MIIIGYQGIGKSTLAESEIKCIDLESGNFWIDGQRRDNWYAPYCEIALDLSRQGYIVFTSSHAVVRDYLMRKILLNKDHKQIYVCYPILGLKDEWIAKLEDRYMKSKLEKDYKAWKNAEVRYEENIIELANSRFKQLPIMSMNYDLRKIVGIRREGNDDL